jgi:hypothetical protein
MSHNLVGLYGHLQEQLYRYFNMVYATLSVFAYFILCVQLNIILISALLVVLSLVYTQAQFCTKEVCDVRYGIISLKACSWLNM